MTAATNRQSVNERLSSSSLAKAGTASDTLATIACKVCSCVLPASNRARTHW